MLVPRPRSVPSQGGVCANPDGDIGRAGDAKYQTRVDDNLRDRDVARYARNCGDLQVRVSYRVEQGERVVDAGVDIDQHRSRHIRHASRSTWKGLRPAQSPDMVR